jgi:hypothetical protein
MASIGSGVVIVGSWTGTNTSAPAGRGFHGYISQLGYSPKAKRRDRTRGCQAIQPLAAEANVMLFAMLEADFRIGTDVLKSLGFQDRQQAPVECASNAATMRFGTTYRVTSTDHW